MQWALLSKTKANRRHVTAVAGHYHYYCHLERAVILMTSCTGACLQIAVTKSSHMRESSVHWGVTGPGSVNYGPCRCDVRQ